MKLKSDDRRLPNIAAHDHTICQILDSRPTCRLVTVLRRLLTRIFVDKT